MDEQIRLYAKQMKIPTFANYKQILRQPDPSLGLSDLLLELMEAECEAQRDNQFRRFLKAAGFPFQKTLDELNYLSFNRISPSRCSRVYLITARKAVPS